MNVLAGSLVSLFSSVALIVYSLLCTESPAQELAVDNTDIDTGDNLYKYLMLIRTPLTAQSYSMIIPLIVAAHVIRATRTHTTLRAVLTLAGKIEFGDSC